MNPKRLPSAEREVHNLTHLGNVQLKATVELGRRDMGAGVVRGLQVGDIIGLAQLICEPAVLRLNGYAFAEGEASVVRDTLALRLTRVLGIG